MGEQEHTPLWVYGEDGIEIPFAPTPEDAVKEMLTVELDRKTKWKIKWQFFRLAVKFLFMRW